MENGARVNYHQLVIPDSQALKTVLLQECHDLAYAGHMGRSKTYEKRTTRVWWPRMYKDTQNYVTGC